MTAVSVHAVRWEMSRAALRLLLRSCASAALELISLDWHIFTHDGSLVSIALMALLVTTAGCMAHRMSIQGREAPVFAPAHE